MPRHVRSGVLESHFDESDSVMADKSFTIEDLLPLGVFLNIPPFSGKSAQMPADQVVITLRIHVERAINKIKKNYIWDGVLPLKFVWQIKFGSFVHFYVMLNLVLFLCK